MLRFHSMRRTWIFVALAFVTGCALDEGTKYGNPSGLNRDNLPTPPEGGTPSVDASCAMEASTGEGGSTCSVSFMNDIWPKMSGTGTWKCAAANCHGGGSTSPSITDPSEAYDALTTYTITNKPYILPCSTDPNASAFLCNLQGMCGNKMPLVDSMLGSQAATPAEIATVSTWVQQCGSPKN